MSAANEPSAIERVQRASYLPTAFLQVASTRLRFGLAIGGNPPVLHDNRHTLLRGHARGHQRWLCQQIVEGTHDAIIVADHDGVIRLWNIGAEEIFGYRAEEAIGQTLDLIIPERLRQRHWEGYHKTMATGVTSYGRTLLAVPAVRKDGVRISLEFSIVLVQDEAGILFGTAALIREVTARWEQEKALKEQLATLREGRTSPKTSP